MEKTILSITGKPGLYSLVCQGRGSLIVETVDEKKRRFPVGPRDRVTSLNDVSMYTEGEDVPLNDVFHNIKTLYEGRTVDLDLKKASADELSDFMAKVLPTYDRERVHLSDIRKLIQWYNLLVSNGINDFEAPQSPENAEAAESAGTPVEA